MGVRVCGSRYPETTHDPRTAARLCAAAGAAGIAQSAGAVVAAATHSAAAEANRFSAGAAVVRYQAAGGDAAAHAVVAHRLAADTRDAGDPRRRRSLVESDGRDRGVEVAAGAVDRRRLPGRRHLGRAHAHRRRPDHPRRERRPRRCADPAVGTEPRHFLRDAGGRARAAQADQAETLCGAALRRAAGARPLLRGDRRRGSDLAF